MGLVPWLAATYAAICAVAYFGNRLFMYFADPTRIPPAAVVLEAPLTSTVDVGRRVYFWLPLSWLVTDRYDNERNIRAVTAPVLILHGERDSIVPVEIGRRLYDAANPPKRIELFPQGGHNDLFDHGAWEKARAFLESLNR